MDNNTKSTPLIFFCNGKKVKDERVDPETTLLSYLRRNLQLTGSKLGCGEGGCGACTVMVSSYDRSTEAIRHVAVNACLTPICAVHGKAVTTVEGIGSTKTKLHPVQERLAAAHGSQCGFCTPGIVMSMYTLLRNNHAPAMQDIMGAFEGNLCRCTGYRPILDGYRTFAKGCGIANCCQNGSASLTNGNTSDGLSTELFSPEGFPAYDPSQEPIFPPDLLIEGRISPCTLTFSGPRVTWFRPVTLSKLLESKSKNPAAKIVVGNTEIGVEVKFKDQLYPILIDVSAIKELHITKVAEDGVLVGSAVSLSQLEVFLKKVIYQKPECYTRGYAALLEMLRWFAGPQIRNVASLGGNIATGSPIADMVPLLMASNSKLTLTSTTGSRTITIDQDFYTGYRKTTMLPGEVITDIFMPFTQKNEFMFGFKQSPRREDDIAIVNAGMRVLFAEGTDTVEDIVLAYGGMAPTTVMAKKTMDNLKGKRWDQPLLEDAMSVLQEELALPPGAPGGMEVYRQSLVLSFFFKFYLKILEQLNELNGENQALMEVDSRFTSAISDQRLKTFRGTQLFQEIPAGQPEHDAVGRPVPYKSALLQATGEAKYIDDLPKLEGELYCAFVFSQKPHAKIKSIDVCDALSLSGVEAVVTADDVPGSNVTGLRNDEKLFAADEVTSVGEIIAVVVAANKDIAQRAAKLVRIQYEELGHILTIEEAIKHDSFMKPTRTIKVGDVESGLKKSDDILEGEYHIGAQEHFYLETMTSIVIPKGEDSEMEIISSTQNVNFSQTLAAKALGVPKNRIVCRAKRLGGAFGGKSTRCAIFSAAAAVAAKKVGKPVRYMLDRDEDMISTGTRHPVLGRYKVGYNKEGRILALELSLYFNCGCTLDKSRDVMQRALLHCDNVYRIQNLSLTGYMCKTNLPSFGAFRGFGIPQAILMTENWMTDVATKLGLAQEKIRELNFYQKDDLTHFKQPLNDWNLDRCWDSCLKQSNFEKRREEIDEYNRENRWRKRGIAVTPIKFGPGFADQYLNQGGALVHIYTDGSVLVTHGGVEMGQGLHTKIIQVASRALRIPKELIHLSESSTDKVPNTSNTAASTSTDLNGMAVQRACETLLQRLDKYITNDPKGGWKAWVSAAYMDRVSLSATGFYRTPVIEYVWDQEEQGGRHYDYFCYGAAVSEVEIDCLTGDHAVLRTDIVMDVGDSINPAVDIGQIEGGFVQGYGLFVLEDYRYSPSGHLLTKGPGFYKIPGFADIPGEFNVSLLDRAPNHAAVCSSKAVGEPPLFLAASVFFAIKEAISSARSDSGLSGIFRLDSPACAERIRLACQDQFTEREPVPGTYQPFFIRP